MKPHEKRAAFFKRYQKYGFESERVMKLLRGPECDATGDETRTASAHRRNAAD
ncbi:MAG: hypothetical protein ACLR07_03410 [Christensenellales bacterium]